MSGGVAQPEELNAVAEDAAGHGVELAPGEVEEAPGDDEGRLLLLRRLRRLVYT